MQFFATNFGETMSWGAKPCFSASESVFDDTVDGLVVPVTKAMLNG
jgi:hypothetical protein